MAGDRLLVHVVLAEWANEALAQHRHVRAAPGVRHPVHEPGDEVGRQIAEQDPRQDEPRRLPGGSPEPNAERHQKS